MERVRFIDHGGQRVLLLDYSNVRDDETILKMVKDRRALVELLPPGSLLSLTDITGAHFSKTALSKIKEAAALDLPYLRRAAIVGIDDSQQDALEAVKNFTTRRWKIFPTRQEALDWLVGDEAAEKQQARAG